MFDGVLKYKDFDKTLLTSLSLGKVRVINKLIKKKHKNIITIGDGVTDLETKSHVDCFIGYGGIVERDIVKDNADVYITDFSEIINMYPHYLIDDNLFKK